jgi:hypothetical protein
VGFLVEPQNQGQWFVSGLASKLLVRFVSGLAWFGLKTGGFGFLGLGLKTSSYDLVICPSKSARWFLGLGLKTKRAMVCQLRYKTDGRMKTVRGTH